MSTTPETIEQLAGQHSAALLQTSSVPRRTARLVVGLLLAGVVVLFLPWQQNIRGDGRVTALNPKDRPQTLVSTIAGRIENWLVAEGSYVRAGDPIVQLAEVKDKYFDPALAARLSNQVTAKRGEVAAKADKMQALDRQIANMRQALVLKLQQAAYKVQVDSAEVVAAKWAYEVGKRQFEGQQALFDKGLKSLTELEQRRLKLQEGVAKLQSAENKLLMARIELQSIAADYQKDIAKAEADRSSTQADWNESQGALLKLESEAAAFGVRQGLYVLRAPQAGYVVKALKQGIGEQVGEQEAVATIMPNNPALAVELYVSANDVPLLQKGQVVRLQFDGWPALQFSGWPSISVGTFGGSIQVIDFTASYGGKYRVLVVPDSTTERWPDPRLLRQGSGVYGWAMLSEVPIWFELWRQLNGFPPALPGVPVLEETGAPTKKKANDE